MNLRCISRCRGFAWTGLLAAGLLLGVGIIPALAPEFAVAEAAAKRAGKAKKSAAAPAVAKKTAPKSAASAPVANAPAKETPAPAPEAPSMVGAPATPADDAANPFASALGLKDKDGKSDGPIEIRSKSVSLDAKERVFTYRGNVEVVRNDLRITSQLMTGRYDEANRLQTIVCERDVVITRGEAPTGGPALRATSNRAVYHVPKAIIELTEGPELFRTGNALSADKVLIYVNEDRSEAEGNVQVKVVKSEDAAKQKR